MPIPRTRAELNDQLDVSYERLQIELQNGSAQLGALRCTDEWTVHQLLAVRSFWTKSTAVWIESGLRGRNPVIPAKGYRWSETPR